MLRPTPFDLVFGPSARDVFPIIMRALEEAGHDPRDRDRFLMLRDVVTLVRELRPEEGLGEGIDQLAALVHHAYLHWAAQEPVTQVTVEQLPSLLRAVTEDRGEAASAQYAQMPQHRIWAEVIPGHPPEPLDGCFVHPTSDGSGLRVFGVFGMHPEREGFSVVEATGPRPLALVRADGTELFSPTLTGGKAAGLYSIAGEEELLDLGWRIQQLGAESWELRAKGSKLAITSSQLPAPGS
ncbi:MAG: hypothetical protein QOH59_1102 [Gemmatimonadales bacterium]|jgi:hypothetical protein|nr:hypothetical protein [Gemmatimonadales bacterium]